MSGHGLQGGSGRTLASPLDGRQNYNREQRFITLEVFNCYTNCNTESETRNYLIIDNKLILIYDQNRLCLVDLIFSITVYSEFIPQTKTWVHEDAFWTDSWSPEDGSCSFW